MKYFMVSLILLLAFFNRHGLAVKTIMHPPQRDSAMDLFSSDSILHISLAGNMRDILKDRNNDAQYHPLLLTYVQNGNTVSIPLKCKTRGNFRRDKANCVYPPILLNFSKLNTANTIFEGQDKIKLVMPCRDDELIAREYLVYKLYNLVTEKSFRARMVNVQLYDSSKNREMTNFMGMILEEEQQLAKRNGMKIMNKKMMRPEYMEKENFLKMAVFEYLIGNTDWSLPYLHNTRIIAFDSLSVPYVVPYDFDHAGIVEAPYASPAEELQLASVRERRYRGYCVTDISAFDEVVAFYNRKKNEIYQLYNNCPYISSKYLKNTIRFLDEFYATINNQKRMRTDFLYPCSTQSGNVIIKGLGN